MKYYNEFFIRQETKQLSDAQQHNGPAKWQHVFWNRVQFPRGGVRRRRRKVAQIWADVVTTTTTTTTFIELTRRRDVSTNHHIEPVKRELRTQCGD